MTAALALLLLAAGPAPTFTADVAPILFARCAGCHHEGEVAPFPLLGYEDARKRARQIARVVSRRAMPPWKPRAQSGTTQLARERRLDEREIATLVAWFEAGAPEGDRKALPPAPAFTRGWALGPPDVVVSMPEPYDVPADGRDVLRNFVVRVPLDADRTVRAIDFRPGVPRVVHHALVYLDANGAARRLDAADPGPGYTSFGGPGFFPTGSLGGWAPGTVPASLPDGLGRLWQRGSDVVIQIHYHPGGKPERDRSQIGVYFTRVPPRRLIGGIAVEDWTFTIPPGAHHTVTASYTLPVDTTFVSAAPHMHLLGRSMRVWAELPAGGTLPLIAVDDWDWNWQDAYHYVRPFTLPRGARLRMEATFDNSAENPANPSSPPRPVRYGEQTTDEMAMCIFEVTANSTGELLGLIADDARARQVLQRALAARRR